MMQSVGPISAGIAGQTKGSSSLNHAVLMRDHRSMPKIPQIGYRATIWQRRT
jgi:hypothetical protein